MPTVRMFGDFGEEYTKGKIIINDPDSLSSDTFYMYAKYRGASSLKYDKKNFAIKLVDQNDSKLNASLLGMRDDNGWILDAMASDKARMRNRVAFDIWNAMNVKPYYYDKEPNVRTGIDGRFVELYINNQYNGLYCLNEKLDRKQLKLKKMKDDVVRGVLYKGDNWYGTSFRDAPEGYTNQDTVYQGFEAVYPDVKDNGVTEWGPLVEKEDFVLNTSNEEFVSEFSTQFDKPVFIDLLILITTIGAMDNHGKNMFFYIYDTTDDKKMSFAPWDMDSSFGRSWDATKFANAFDKVSFDNNLYKRLKNLDGSLLDSIANRYFELRKTVLSTDSLKARFDDYFRYFAETGAGAREYLRWNGKNGIKLNFVKELKYLHEYLDYRMEILDEYYRLKHIPVRVENPVIYDFLGRQVDGLQPGRFFIWNGRGVWIMR